MAFGILFSFLASIGFNLSNLLEKRAVDEMAGISARRMGHMVRSFLRSRLWLAGFVSGVVAVGLMVIGYALAPIAVVQSIFGAGLVFLVIASRIYLREPMGRREWAGLGVIIIAVVLVSVTLGSRDQRGDGGGTIEALVTTGATIAFAAVLFTGLRRTPVDPSVPFATTAGLLYGVASLQTKSASVLLASHGIIRGIPSVVASPYPYLFVVASILGLLVFQTGLQRSRVAMIGPLTNIIASVYIVAVGMVVFNEPLPSSTALTVLRLLGFALVLAGSWMFGATSPGPALVGEAAAVDLEQRTHLPARRPWLTRRSTRLR
ncbi:MAG: hypothetical protein JWM85_1474 [Acidimicrobiaceae bacterium]|nr:hypothetical protein [Acidimicrobiaceae bacterium]